jgi:hypothetical protein
LSIWLNIKYPYRRKKTAWAFLIIGPNLTMIIDYSLTFASCLFNN